MAAALAQRRRTGRGDGLQPTSFARDLGQIAELIEVCFAEQMDSGGRSAVSEMKIVSRLGPLVWLLALLDRYVAGLGTGYVWRSDGRVIGNVSLYRGGHHPRLGPGWMIANVSVHPDFRRRGIALAMMEATIERARREGGRWIVLEVEADNEGAIALYQRLGFWRYETLAIWEAPAFYNGPSAAGYAGWAVRRRRWEDAPAETDLIFNRARQGAMAWTQPIDRQTVSSRPLDLMSMGLSGALREHWVMEDPAQPGRLAGALWVETYGWHNARMTQFLDPALADPGGRRSLVASVMGLEGFDGWSIRLETAVDDEPVTSLLKQLGFRQTRVLTQMRLSLDEQLTLGERR